MPPSEITAAQQEITLPRPQTVLPKLRAKSGYRTLLLALTTGGLLWLCYFPVAWGWLAWLALVPLLALVRSSARPWVIYLSAWAGGLVFCWPVMQWMRVADPRMYFTWFFLATYCSLYFPLALYLIRRLDRRTSLPLVLTVPIVWTALELLRSTFGTGFSWYLLGHTQHDFLPMIQIADLTGAYGVTYLVAAVNAFVFEILWSRRWFRAWLSGPEASPRWGRIGLLAQGLAVLLALAGTAGYGFWRLGQDHLKPGPRLALVQGNLDQRIKNASAFAEDAARQVVGHFIELSDLAARYQPDLIVWPETSYPQDWMQNADGTPTEHSRETAHRMATRWGTNLLVGINGVDLDEDDRQHRYNSAVLIQRNGTAAGRYDKIHRVPFGEYVPLRDWLPWMNYFAPYDFDYSVWPGRRYTRFTVANSATERRFTFGVLICYEDTDADVARPYGGGDGEPPADFLINISNDGWFDGSSEHDEHLAVCRFRAVECRRSVARSVNMGISAVIDSNGRVLQSFEFVQPGAKTDLDKQFWTKVRYRGSLDLPVSRWHEYKKVSGVLLAVVPIDDRSSFYARWGDWLPWMCWMVIGGAFAFLLVRRFARPIDRASPAAEQQRRSRSR
jgi:apolipoprotein N-acyltransferase